MDEADHYKFIRYKYEVERADRAKRRMEDFASCRAYVEYGFKERDEKTLAEFEAKYGKL